MSEFLSKPCTAFAGYRMIVAGPLAEVALAVKAKLEATEPAACLTFDDATGAVVDLDLRGTPDDIRARLAARVNDPKSPTHVAQAASPGRGRPKLGVVAREVTLLPRHWAWLESQPGGASQALRRLVEEARREGGGRDRVRLARERAYRFMSALAGDLPGFEDAARALFAGDADRFAQHIAAWPADVSGYANRLAADREP